MLYRGWENIQSEIEFIFLFTQVIQFDQNYKSRVVGVSSEIGFTMDRRPFRAISLHLILPSLQKPVNISAIPDVTWY